MSFDDDMMEQFFSDFVIDSRELLANIDEDLNELMPGADPELYNRIFRGFHSIKGNAHFIAFQSILPLTHKAEDLMDRLRKGKQQFSTEARDLLQETADLLGMIIDGSRSASEPTPYADQASDLISRLERCTGGAVCETRPTGPPAVTDDPLSGTTGLPQGLRVLVVEDEFVSRTKLVALFSRYAACDSAENGRQAVEAFQRYPHYDVICMDIMMPEMDGTEAVKEIRRIEAERKDPQQDEAVIFMITAVEDPKTIVRAYYECGATSYFIKPVNPDRLRKEILLLGIKGRT